MITREEYESATQKSLAGHPWWPHQGEKAGVGKPMETLRNSWEKTKGFRVSCTFSLKSS